MQEVDGQVQVPVGGRQLDQLVDALTDELEYRFPRQWSQVEDHVYAAEAMFFHIPHDPNTDDGPPIFLQCPRCRDLAATHRSPSHRPDDPGALARSAQPARRSTSDRRDAATAEAAHIQEAS